MHTREHVHGLRDRVESHHANGGALAKKTALFDEIHDMVVASRDYAKQRGATDDQMRSFDETIKHFEAERDHLVQMNLGD